MPPARVNVLLNDPSLTWPEKLTLRTYFGSKSSATVTSDQFSQRHDCASRTAICSAVNLRKVFIFYVYYCDNLYFAANVRISNLIAMIPVFCRSGGGHAGIITVRIPEACVSAQSYPRQSFRNILQSFHRSV